MRDALQRLGGIAEPPLEAIVPCEPEIYHYRNKLEYSFTRTDDGVALGFHRAGRWDEVLDIDRCWLTGDLGNGIRDAVRDWAREEGLQPYSQVDGNGLPRHLVVREGRNTGQVLVQLVTGPGEKFETGYLVDVLRQFPEVTLDPLVGQRHAGRGDEPAVTSALGRAVDRGGAERPALPRAAERVPADEHRDGGAAVRARAARRRSSPAARRSGISTAGSGRSGSRSHATR